MQSEVDEIIKQIPAWKDVDKFQVEPLAGLTNTNYLVTVNGDRFVLRVSGQNTLQLGINREYEYEALSAVSKAGIGAQVEYYLLPEGHLVTRFINGHHLTLEEYRTPENIQRIVKTVKRLHKLPLTKAAFSHSVALKVMPNKPGLCGFHSPKVLTSGLKRWKRLSKNKHVIHTPGKGFVTMIYSV